MKVRFEMEMIRDYANDALDIWGDYGGKGRKNSKGYDVLLSTQTSNGKYERITVTFYGEACDTVSTFARIKLSSLQKVRDKIYFALYATDDPRLGYAITPQENRTTRICKTVPPEDVDRVAKNYRGYYDLKFDNDLGLYYIDLKERRRA